MAAPPLAKLDWALLAAIRAGIALLLFTPLVVTNSTIFPFVVGKALYFRTLVELLFMLWALLALRAPAYRPSRSRLLALLAAGLGVSVLAAAFGVSWQRSLWSNYERMLGLVDMAHGFALILVLASTLRTGRELRVFLNINLGIGMAAALIAIAKFNEVHLPFFGGLPEQDYARVNRVGATFGNAALLGVYMLPNLFVALGFLARSLVAAPGAADGKRRGAALLRWLARLFWASAALADFWALNLSGTRGVLLGLAAAGSSLGLLFAALAHARLLRIAGTAWTGLVAAGMLALAALFFGWVSLPSTEFSSPMLQRTAQAIEFPKSMLQRQASWEAGLKAFAERPLLGWGPENYVIAFGRHVPEEGASIEVHDRAHSEGLEELATKGLLGLLIYLALWGRLFQVLLRGAKHLDSREQVLTLFVGAALAGDFVQAQFLFDSHPSNLQYLLLLAFMMHLEARLPAERSRWLRRPARLAKAFAMRWVARCAARLPPMPQMAGRVAIGLGAALLGGGGLFANQATFSAAQSVSKGLDFGRLGLPELSLHYFDLASARFPPLAHDIQALSLRLLRRHWPFLRSQGYLEGRRLLAKAEEQAALALAAEPENWQTHQTLASLYRTVAATDPSYQAAADRYAQRSLELAPNR